MSEIDDGGYVYPQGHGEGEVIQYPGTTQRDDMIKTFIAAMLSNPNFVSVKLASDFIEGGRGGKYLREFARNMADALILEGRKGGE